MITRKSCSARLVHMSSSEGHREDYQRVLSSALGLSPSTGKVSRSNFLHLFQAQALLFGSLDDDVKGFLLIAVVRMLIGKKTGALFLRPQSCFSPLGLGATCKYAIFRALSKLPMVSIFTIVPFEIEPKYRKIAKQGVADPQLWDRMILPFQPSFQFAKHLRDLAGGRRILAFIGTASPFKGVRELCNMMAHPQWDNSVFVLLAGKVPDAVSDAIRAAEARGAVVIPRFISNDELDAIYYVADIIWAGYQPSYDQASGNFGRAVQAGKIPVVREGTLIERLAQLIDYPVLTIDFDNLQEGIERLQGCLPITCGPPHRFILRSQEQFVTNMKNAL